MHACTHRKKKENDIVPLREVGSPLAMSRKGFKAYTTRKVRERNSKAPQKKRSSSRKRELQRQMTQNVYPTLVLIAKKKREKLAALFKNN
jgi:hypothetical protein